MLEKGLLIVRTLSLDVVLGAIISSLFVAKYLSITLPVYVVLALGISVWIIYTADHLSDAYSTVHEAHSYRHRFHQRYFRPLSIALATVATGSLYLLTRLPPVIIYSGVSILALVVLYFVLIHVRTSSHHLPKELIIAILYSLGIFLAPLSLSSGMTPLVFILFIQFVMLALVNLLIISWYERANDLKDGYTNFVNQVGESKALSIIRTIILSLYLSVSLSMVLGGFSLYNLKAQAIVLCMVLTLHLITRYRHLFGNPARYRTLADAVFCYPIFYLWCS